MVAASQNKDARLHHSYAARHLEQEMCAVGQTLLWLHFVYDQLSQSPTSRLVPPLDFSTPYMWYDKTQKQLPPSSHSRITQEMWRMNKIFITRNTHAARAGGVQELADDGVPRSDIADLGHWALDKLAKSYIMTIPKAAVLRKAGYTGKRSDYHLGRSMIKPDDKVVALIAQHFFPWAEAELAKAEKCATGREPNTAGVHFLQSLIEFGRRIVAEDLACMLMREPWHPYVQSSKLCRDPDFQKWAKDVNWMDLETIATRRTPSENPQEVDQLTMMLHRQREDAAVEKLEMQKKLEEKDAEIARLMQALKLAEARPTPTAPAPSRPMTDAEKAAAVKIEKEQDEDLTYEVEKADKPAASAKSAKSSRGRKAPTDDCPTIEVGETGKNDALQNSTRRMKRIMETVYLLRRSENDADTTAVVKLLDHLGRAGLSIFSDALVVLRATTPMKVPTTADGKPTGIKGLDKPQYRKLAVAWGVVSAGYADPDWGKEIFGDLWEEQAEKVGLEAEATVGARAESSCAGKRKRAG
ncbi:unnamed protein product [Closterium sp. Naga37s-1]|nr:unnamed protein product [Closterium sp. Naga37s-1]